MSYTAAQAARLTGCTPSQLRHWNRRGLLVPTGSDGGYEFRDLGAARVVRSLLDTGLPSQRVSIALRSLVDAGTELASLRLVTDGRNVWACHDDGEILDALRHGQLALFVDVDSVAADVEAEVHAFDDERQAFLDGLRDVQEH